jgi:hypothetical protein
LGWGTVTTAHDHEEAHGNEGISVFRFGEHDKGEGMNGGRGRQEGVVVALKPTHD